MIKKKITPNQFEGKRKYIYKWFIKFTNKNKITFFYILYNMLFVLSLKIKISFNNIIHLLHFYSTLTFTQS